MALELGLEREGALDKRKRHPMEAAAVAAASAWGLAGAEVRFDLPIGGSPQRTEFRCVVEAGDGRLVVMEALRPQDVVTKKRLLNRLDFLAGHGFCLARPYLRTSAAGHFHQAQGRFWQAAPYIAGVCLDRPAYAFDGWRGEAAADALIALRPAAAILPRHLAGPRFSILDYVENLMVQVRTREPGLAENLTPIRYFLEKRLKPVNDDLPSAFCHGDFHPLNLIWSDIGLLALIDWEFSGVKPELYDAATFIGCIGMEHPDALVGPLVSTFVRKIRQTGGFAEESWNSLVELTVAIRFGWLAEWLRIQDRDMAALETEYLHLLADHAEMLGNRWRQPPGYQAIRTTHDLFTPSHPRRP